MKPDVLERRADYAETQERVLSILKEAGDALSVRMVSEKLGYEAHRVLLKLQEKGCVESYEDDELGVSDRRRGRTMVLWYRFVKPLPPRREGPEAEYDRAYSRRRRAQLKQERQANEKPPGAKPTGPRE